MKTISARTRAKFMAAFVQYARIIGRSSFRLHGNSRFDFLKKRKDYITVLKLLESQGFCTITWADDGKPFVFHLTDIGYSYFENSVDARREQRWTRGLAIAALVLSLASILIQFVNGPWFAKLVTALTNAPG